MVVMVNCPFIVVAFFSVGTEERKLNGVQTGPVIFECEGSLGDEIRMFEQITESSDLHAAPLAALPRYFWKSKSSHDDADDDDGASLFDSTPKLDACFVRSLAAFGSGRH